MRRFYITLALGVIGAAAVLAQDAQTPAGKIDSEGNQVASGADGGGGYLRSCGIADGHPQRGSRQGRALHDAATGSANTKIQAHSHKDDRTAVVLSGVWYFGYGREFNDAALKELPASSFYTEPPGAEHFAMTKGPEAIIEITGYGPSATAYVDARNDPAKK